MKVISCTGYFSSGSSALTDLVAEYNPVFDLSNFEFRFLHDLDGISDLEFQLVECHNRHNSGHAIKRYQKLARFYEGNRFSRKYSAYFKKGDFRRITDKYIDSLIDFKFPGWWFYDLYDRGTKIYYLYQIANHLYHKTGIPLFRIMKNELTYCSHPDEETFLKLTRDYVTDVLNALNSDNKEYIEVNQIVPSSNIERMLRYFNEQIFVFVVDRDPRDIFLLEKYYLKHGIAPTDPELFCKWFRYNREAGHGIPDDDPRIIKLQFEDIVYNYDDVVSRLEQVTGLKPEHHTAKFIKMNPKRSVCNTQVWKRGDDPEAVKIIEKLLPEYLYDFESVKDHPIVGIDINSDMPF